MTTFTINPENTITAFPTPDQAESTVGAAMLAVDSGYATSEVSAWFRRQIASRVVVRPQPGAGLSSVCQGGRSRIGHGSTYRE